MSVNKVILLGRLGKDVELKYTQSGIAVANFSMATTMKTKKEETTEWHNVVVWDKLAELCGQYLSKGKQAFVEGRLQTRSWEDKNGAKRYTTEIVAQTVQFLNSDNKTNNSPGVEAAKDVFNQKTVANFDANDLPF